MTVTDSSERKLVLEMLADGKISVEDAQRLLDKLQDVESSRQNAGGADAPSKPRPKHLRIVIAGGEDELSLRIPLGLVRAGLALDSFLPSWAQSRLVVGSSLADVIDLDQSVIDLDKDYLRENLDELDMTFDSEEGETVRIYSE